MNPTHVVVPTDRIKTNPKNARTHNKRQIRKIADSIREFGFAAPILIDEQDMLIAGHGRLEAARSLGMSAIPAVIIKGLSEGKKRALMLADNRIAQDAGWDLERLAEELGELPELLAEDGLEVSITGFEPAEIDRLCVDFGEDSGDPADDIDLDELNGPTITRACDLWRLGKHKLFCGDARRRKDLMLLLGDERVHMVFTDPPYNVKVGSIVGRGARKHREFAMASGEMDRETFIRFLSEALGAAAEFSTHGSVHFVCMDWRHVEELIAAGRIVYDAMLNLIVWTKTNAGQGSFYRSQHELIGVFRKGAEPHLNTIELGRHGRNRSNVWSYAGANTFRKGRLEDLRGHPTVKPVGMIADAIRDCTRRGQIVLDTFCGSGATLLAAERVGRQGRGVEIDPAYVDLAIRRWQTATGRDAVHVESGRTFEEMGARRAETPNDPVARPIGTKPRAATSRTGG